MSVLKSADQNPYCLKFSILLSITSLLTFINFICRIPVISLANNWNLENKVDKFGRSVFLENNQHD